MLRRAPLVTHVPLRSTTPLRRTPFKRKASTRRIPPDVREAVLRRDGGCTAVGAFGIVCGGGVELHHVETKGMGGKRDRDTEGDLRSLCAAHHHYVTEHPLAAIEAGLARRRNR